MLNNRFMKASNFKHYIDFAINKIDYQSVNTKINPKVLKQGWECWKISWASKMIHEEAFLVILSTQTHRLRNTAQVSMETAQETWQCRNERVTGTICATDLKPWALGQIKDSPEGPETLGCYVSPQPLHWYNISYVSMLMPTATNPPFPTTPGNNAPNVSIRDASVQQLHFITPVYSLLLCTSLSSGLASTEKQAFPLAAGAGTTWYHLSEGSLEICIQLYPVRTLQPNDSTSRNEG